eukprot:s395_g25.t1
MLRQLLSVLVALEPAARDCVGQFDLEKFAAFLLLALYVHLWAKCTSSSWNPGNADTARKRTLDDLDRRLTQAENRLTQHNDRLDHVELRLELDQSYRFLQVEACKGLADMFDKVEKGEAAKGDIRDVAGQTLTRDQGGA